jgi:hypothetical protein
MRDLADLCRSSGVSAMRSEGLKYAKSLMVYGDNENIENGRETFWIKASWKKKQK